MTTATETLTIHLSREDAQRLRRMAEIAQRPVDEILADTLRAHLPPLPDDVPPEFRTELTALESLSNEGLQAQVRATYRSELLQRYDELLAMNSAGALSEAERKELEVLRAEGNRLMFRKAYAAQLLKWRGLTVPTLDELPEP